MPIRSLARWTFFFLTIALTVVGCGRSWLDELDEGDAGLGDGGLEGGRDSGPDVGTCDAATCAGGCCTSTGICIAGTSVNACGIGGAVCVDCTTAGFQQCDSKTHACENVVTQCTPASCPTGCCSGNLCVAGTSTNACGDFGNVCQDCSLSGLACQGQACTQAGCGPGNCTGCCFGNQCVAGVSQTACGFEGQQCQNCEAQNEQCEPTPAGGGVCEGVVTNCNATTCPGGCCDLSGNCEPGIVAGACGVNGQLCQNCLQLGETCTLQQCVPPAPCGPQTCPTGCCDQLGQCETGTSSASCGFGGSTCENCAQFGETCEAGQCVINGCGPSTCPSGCCDANGTCQTGTSPTECGFGGGTCQSCASQGEICQMQECVSPTCNAQTCPAGCCSGNTCVAGTQNAACGTGGVACVNCTTSGEACNASQRCVATPPPCSPATCPTGCCDANGFCEAGFIDTACGEGGAACVNCTTSGTTCDTAVDPRVCSSTQMTCPATYGACPPSLQPTPTTTSSACTSNDLANAAAACGDNGAHSTQCASFFTFEQTNNPSCGTCLKQFDYDLTEVQGLLACIAPFVSDPTCGNTVACLDQCENVSCSMCSAGALEGCESTVEQGQCSTWTNGIQCTFTAFEGTGAVCNPNDYSGLGPWLQAVGQTYCAQ